MKHVVLASLMVACLSAIVPAQTADSWLERLATCQDSWLDWKNDPVQTKKLAQAFDAAFKQKPDGGSWVPRTPAVVAGLPVAEAFPESVGMGVGFSLVVEADFAAARRKLEKAIGRPLTKCENGEGMRTCELQIAEKRTLMLMAPDDPTNKKTLVGCYYYYAK